MRRVPASGQETPEAKEEIVFRSPSQAAGFTQANNLVLLDTDLSDGAKVTFLLLLMYAWQGANAFPGQKRMAAERGASDRTIRNHLTELEERGLITIEQRGKKLTNRYWIESLDNVYSAADLPLSRQQKLTSLSDRKNSSTHVTGNNFPPSDRKNSSSPYALHKEDSVIEIDSDQSLNVAESPRRNTKPATRATVNENESDGYTRLILDPILHVEELTGDQNSRNRYIQLREICLVNKRLSAWNIALESTQRRMKKSRLDPLEKPGAYFDSAVVRELDKYGVIVPKTVPRKEKEEVRGAIAASLGFLREGDAS